MASLSSTAAPRARAAPALVLRHSVLVRVCHWVNALCFFILLMSGLQIFNAHPSLSWGQGDELRRPLPRLRGEGKRRRRRRLPARRRCSAIRSTRPASSAPRAVPTARWRSAAFPPGRRCRPSRTWRWAGAGTSFSPGCFVLNGLVYVANLFAGRHLRDLWPSLARSQRASRERSATTRACASPKARRRCITTCCRSSPTSSVVVAFPVLVLAGLTMSPAHGRGLSLAAYDLPRTPVGAHGAFRSGDLPGRFRRRASRDGAALGRLQQHALDDHRPLPDRGGRAMKPASLFSRRALLRASRPAASCRLPAAASIRARRR